MGDMSDILSGSSDVGASDPNEGSGIGASPVVPATPGPALIQRSQASPSDPNTLQGGMAPEAEPSAAGNQSHGVNWKALLMGALVGVAGSAGQRGRQNFGSGLAAGAKADLDFNQQQTANDQRQQELTQQKTFQYAQSAYHVAALSQQGKQLELQTAEYQDKHDESVQNAVKFNTDNGYAQYDVIPRTSAAAMQYIKQASANSPDGAAIPPGVLMTSTDIYVPKTGTNSFQQQLDYMKKVAPAINVQAPTDDQWQRLNPTQKNTAYSRVTSTLMGLDPNTQENYTAAQLPGAIATMQTSVDKFSKVPDHDPALLTQMQNTLGLLQAQQKSINDNAANAKAQQDKAGKLAEENTPGGQLALQGQRLTNQKTATDIQKTKSEMSAMNGSTDAFGAPIGVTPEGQQLPLKEYNSRVDKFSKDYVQPLTVLQKTNEEFNRINSDPNQTGAERVTALLNAVGISGDPLKGKGFRISNDIINEHATARNIWQGAVQKLNTVAGNGGPITSQQIADYTAIAKGVVHDAYVTAAQEARRQGLPVNFLPKPTQAGQAADAFTAGVYLDAAQGNKTAARNAAKAAGWNF